MPTGRLPYEGPAGLAGPAGSRGSRERFRKRSGAVKWPARGHGLPGDLEPSPGSHRRGPMPRSLLLPLAFFALPLAASAAGKPNVLVVMTDDQGLGDFSYTGNPALK